MSPGTVRAGFRVRPRIHRIGVAAIAGVVLAACAGGGGGQPAGDGAGAAPVAEGMASPAGDGGPAAPASLSFADIYGVVKAIDEQKGRPVLLNFWATWCAPCLHEMPDLALLAHEYGDGRAAFLGVSLDAWVSGDGSDTEHKVREALKEAGVGYDNLIYRGDQDPLVDQFEMSGAIPYTILYDPLGTPLKVWEGRVGIDDLRKALDDLC
jgi:thiol-disulfide isomerase/thioredoxin